MQSKRRQHQVQSSSSAAGVPHHHHHHHHHLQPVQDEDLRRLHLPPSIPVSRDGEEGAAVYNLRLQQSNADAKPDCYQAPPNRTVYPVEPLGVSASTTTQPAVLSQHSTSTPSLKQIGATSPTQLDSSSKFRSAKGKMPLPPPTTRFADPHRHPGTDYVSGSLLSSWRATSPDRWEASVGKCIIPEAVGGGLPSPPGNPPRGGAIPSGEEDPAAAAAAGKRPTLTKQRSSSADSVRRLVAKCSLLRFTRKQTTKAPKPSTSGVPLAIDSDRKQLDEQLDEGETSSGVAKDQEAPPWELPPNYVDMIFTKDPPPTATADADKKDNVIKQQHQEKQQRQQQQHCCFNS